MAGPSTIRRISGSVPGLLDPTQPDRLLRMPGSRLHFAAFDPLTATARQCMTTGFRKLSIGRESCRPKRIVVEITPSGDSFWRYVPNALLEEGVKDEGDWPRAIDICGEIIECSKDQWDIYKLDPLYICHVRIRPHLTCITRVTDSKATSEVLHRKRPPASPPLYGRSAQRKRMNGLFPAHSNDEDTSSDDMDVEVTLAHSEHPLPMNEGSHALSLGSGRAKRTIPSCKGKRIPKRGTPPTRLEDIPEFCDNFPKKRRRESPDIPEPLLGGKREHNTYTAAQNGKRARTVSPTSSRREMESKRQAREQSKERRRAQVMLARREERDEMFFDALISEAAYLMQEHVQDGARESVEPELEIDEEKTRQSIIEESRRKLAELEADKPLWEAAAKRRMMRERTEEESIRVKAGHPRTNEKEETERKVRILREMEEKRMKEESERRQKEEAAQRERERRQRQQQRWAFGPWTPQRALERYKVLSEEFDSTKFSAELPLTMEAVPWPVLTPPSRLNIAHVDWNAVEKFFTAVSNHMKPQDYKMLIEKSHRRFHPDRWRSRSLLKTVLDGTERDNMEVAANTVAQALTPIWREVTGRH